MADQLVDRRRFRLCTIVDDYSALGGLMPKEFAKNHRKRRRK